MSTVKFCFYEDDTDIGQTVRRRRTFRCRTNLDTWPQMDVQSQPTRPAFVAVSKTAAERYVTPTPVARRSPGLDVLAAESRTADPVSLSSPPFHPPPHRRDSRPRNSDGYATYTTLGGERRNEGSRGPGYRMRDPHRRLIPINYTVNCGIPVRIDGGAVG